MKEMDRLVKIMETLRGPGGCPWDAQQDHKSLVPSLLEEAYELAEAIENQDPSAMKEELGDVLLQVVFHSVIAGQEGEFTISDVICAVSDKLVYRHPHVFGDLRVKDSSEVTVNWDRLKNGEKGKKDRTSIADGIPKNMPALLYALKLQSRAERAGFDWDDVRGVVGKLREETEELEKALSQQDPAAAADEIGDLIFTAVNLARKTGTNPEAALQAASRRFAERYAGIEKEARRQGVSAADIPMDEKERIWQRSK